MTEKYKKFAEKPLINIGALLKVFPDEEGKIFLGIIIERALKGNLKLYWHLENRLARKVSEVSTFNRPTLLPYSFAESSKRLKRKLLHSSVIAQKTYWHDPSKAYFVADTLNIQPETSPYRLYAPCSKKAEGLHGKVCLEINEKNLLMTEWLHTQNTGIHKEIISFDGVIVSTDRGLFQLIEDINDKISISIYFPEMQELYITAKDVEAIQQGVSCAQERQNPFAKEKTSYLNIIGGLLACTCKGTRQGYLEKNIITQEAFDVLQRGRYTTEEQVIQTICEVFPHVQGLKKSNLQNKFRDAKRKLYIPNAGSDDE